MNVHSGIGCPQSSALALLRAAPFPRVRGVTTWAAIAISTGTPVLTFMGVLVAQYLLRKGANEVEVRSRREETLRVLRWAAELAVSADDRDLVGMAPARRIEQSREAGTLVHQAGSSVRTRSSTGGCE